MVGSGRWQSPTPLRRSICFLFVFFSILCSKMKHETIDKLIRRTKKKHLNYARIRTKRVDSILRTRKWRSFCSSLYLSLPLHSLLHPSSCSIGYWSMLLPPLALGKSTSRLNNIFYFQSKNIRMESLLYPMNDVLRVCRYDVNWFNRRSSRNA